MKTTINNIRLAMLLLGGMTVMMTDLQTLADDSTKPDLVPRPKRYEAAAEFHLPSNGWTVNTFKYPEARVDVDYEVGPDNWPAVYRGHTGLVF